MYSHELDVTYTFRTTFHRPATWQHLILWHSHYIWPESRRRSRLDQYFTMLADWAPDNVEMVCTRPLGLLWQKPLKAGPVPR